MLHRSKFTPLMLLLAAAPMLAQETTGTAVGMVTGKTGKPIAGALVRLVSPNLLGERTATTNEKGQFRISLLPNGKFAITV